MTSGLEQPRLWVFAGPNGSGKSTLFDQMLRGEIIQVNADEIARGMDPAFGAESVAKAGRLAVTRRADMLTKRESLSVETTLAGHSMLSYMRDAKDAGYLVNLAYVGISVVELSRARINQRVNEGGHDIPQKAVERRYPASLNNLERALRLADRSLIYDNSAEIMRLELHIENGAAIYARPDLPDWVLKNVPEELRRTKGVAGPGRIIQNSNDPFEI